MEQKAVIEELEKGLERVINARAALLSAQLVLTQGVFPEVSGIYNMAPGAEIKLLVEEVMEIEAKIEKIIKGEKTKLPCSY